jgi:hypothetical protein
MFKFFKRKSQIPNNEIVVIKLPGARATEGKIDRYSSTWLFVQSWAEMELTKVREQNDYLKVTELKTAALRGRIKLLKEIIKLPETGDNPRALDDHRSKK